MSSAESLSWLPLLVVGLSFLVATATGAIITRTDYCAMGAVADLYTMGNPRRLRMWLGAIGVAIVLTQALAAGGLIDPSASIYTGRRLQWLSHLAGGLTFGFGMVLGSGCGARTLTRLGTGSLKALVVALTMAVSAYMTLKGLFAVPRTQLLDAVAIELPVTQDLPSLLAHLAGLGDTGPGWRFGVALVPAAALLLAALARPGARDRTALLAIAGVGMSIAAIWWISGHLGYLPEHPDTLEPVWLRTNSARMESLSFVSPLAYTLEWLMLWTDRTRTVTVGIATTLGLIAGSAAGSIAGGQFRWRGFGSIEDLANHLAGAVLMGFGGVTALGCTFGQGLSGLSMLSAGAAITTLAIVAGAWLGLTYQARRIG